MMPATDERFNDTWTVGQIQDQFEGETHVTRDDDPDTFKCDFCSKFVSYHTNPRVGYYLADNVMNADHPTWQRAVAGGEAAPMVPLAIYCEGCTKKRLYFPCTGYGEGRLLVTMQQDRTQTDARVTDISPPDDGIPYDPKAFTQAISPAGINFETRSLAEMLMAGPEGAHLWGPENMITWFLSTVDGVDPREIIQPDGSLDRQALGRARTAMKRTMEKLSKHRNSEGHVSEGVFTDHVRGNR